MKIKIKKDISFLIHILFCFVFLSISNLMTYHVFAIESENDFIVMQMSKEYLEYLNLSEEEKNATIMPRMYVISKSNSKISNPFRLARMLGSSLTIDYTLQTVIPENMIIKNQQSTNSCWTFSSLATLETNLALKDKKENKTPVIYDFSERHMEYATSQSVLDDETNEKTINDIGFSREVGDGGNYNLYIPYLTNGTGAVHEDDMEFKNDENPIYISEIKDTKVITQVNDTISFPAYNFEDDKTEIMQQMKEHIKNYGAIDAAIYGASLSDNTCYNSETGAIYCNDSSTYKINHAVAIIGWDEDYPIENFAEGNKPANPGAWIVKNSWGETAGDKGYMYVSYEDANIYLQLNGIVSAQNEIEYENIYQYDEFGGMFYFGLKNTPKLYLATEFDKQTETKEYLTQVSINVPQETTCKVYVNLDGTSKAKVDLDAVQLKAGESETISAGYHTLEFKEPLKINAESFVVVIETEATSSNIVSTFLECNYGEFTGTETIWDNVTVESEKCFYAKEAAFLSNKWTDTSTLYTKSKGSIPNGDTTIKAFTTSNVVESIFVSNPPSKTEYVVGQDFDPTGMIVKANYANGNSIEITDYVITDGTSLGLGQTSVTISYKGKTVTQEIEVVENTVESIKIATVPIKTEYWAGEDFDSTGMVIEATYKDGTTKSITNGYTVKDGKNIKNGQKSVTIEYEKITITQTITVKNNNVVKIEIISNAIKLDYSIGQNFNSEGMIVEVTYADGTSKKITDYTVQDGINLKEGQTTVTIEYEGKTTTQSITVVAKAITSISIKNVPAKTQYIQSREKLDLTGGIIKITYNDETTEEMSMVSEEITVSGFNTEELGIQTITLTYQGKTTQFNVEVNELPKPQNSNFDNMQGSVGKIKLHYYTDSNTREYTIINIELSGIEKNAQNDNMEYYYSLSSNKQETNITDWVKINLIESTNDKISFEIKTSDISNYEDVVNASSLYLYIKEIATRNNMKSEVVTSSIKLEVENINIEEYVDGEKKDTTTAKGIIPNAGKDLLIMLFIFVIILIGRITYLRYKNIEIE